MCFPRRQESIQEALWGAEPSPVGPLLGRGLTEGGGQGSLMPHLGGGRFLGF